MKPKKNPAKDLRRNSSLYFAIGLTIVLFISWQAIEWKTYEKLGFSYEALDVDEVDEEEVPMTEPMKAPPPPPPAPPAPQVLEVVEDEEEVEETIIESTETDQEEIIEVEDVEVEEDFDDDDPVPFAVIEDVPIYPGCENVAKSERRNCFQEQINKHVRNNFRYPEIAQQMGIQGRVYMHFVIDKDGSITDIKIARSPDRNLGIEAERIIHKLPKMTPGKQRGRPVRVPFSIPITFRLQ